MARHTMISSDPRSVIIGRVATVLYAAGLLVDPLFGYSSVPLFAALVLCVVVAVVFRVGIWTLAIITILGLGLLFLALFTAPHPKGPHGLLRSLASP